MDPAVVVEDLFVTYGDLIAVDHVSFEAHAGTVTVVLGPNGAGKTTTIEVCEGYRTPTSGGAVVLGMNPARQQTQLSKRMGVMLQDGGVSPSARVGDMVQLYCDLYGNGVEPGALIERVSLTERASANVRRISGGEKQRLSLALALAAAPDVAFLDEPTSGVDIAGRQLIRTIIADLAASGCAVIVATHELDEAEKIADHVVIFDRGRIVADDSLDALRSGHDEIRFVSSPDLDVNALAAVVQRPVRAVRDTPNEYVVEGDASLVAAVSAWLAEQAYPLDDLRAGRQRLEDVFLRLTGEPRDPGTS